MTVSSCAKAECSILEVGLGQLTPPQSCCYPLGTQIPQTQMDLLWCSEMVSYYSQSQASGSNCKARSSSCSTGKMPEVSPKAGWVLTGMPKGQYGAIKSISPVELCCYGLCWGRLVSKRKRAAVGRVQATAHHRPPIGAEGVAPESGSLKVTFGLLTVWTSWQNRA